ncbi:MAG: tetratricopeptide repeat protein [Syntrophobacteraceae bacterium]
MTRWLFLLFMSVLVGFAGLAHAGFDDGTAAYDKGDYGRAYSEMRPLAERGEAPAQFYLGVMYENGQGVPKDYVQAHKWFELAAAQGDSEARKRMDLLAEKMTPAQIAEAISLARDWKPKRRD